MPYINVRITEGASQAQKEKIIKQITTTMQSVLGKNPKSTFVVIDDVRSSDWGVAGKSIAAHQQDNADK